MTSYPRNIVCIQSIFVGSNATVLEMACKATDKPHYVEFFDLLLSLFLGHVKVLLGQQDMATRLT